MSIPEPVQREFNEAFEGSGHMGDALKAAVQVIDEQVGEILSRERANAPQNPNTPGGGMTIGAIEILEELRRYLRDESE